MDDGLRTRTKVVNIALGGGVDLEGGSPRKNHGLGHNFGLEVWSVAFFSSGTRNVLIVIHTKQLNCFCSGAGGTFL